MKRSRIYGFTLIEVMIAIAIVGILSSLAIYMFQIYSNKAKVSSAVIELRSLAAKYDALYVSGIISPSLEDLDVSDSTRCRFSVGSAPESDADLRCELINVYGALLGGVLTYNRSSQGRWICGANQVLKSDVLPIKCR
jgi:prepilin-type N-terminal cleavage/methylation domain-containing protein